MLYDDLRFHTNSITHPNLRAHHYTSIVDFHICTNLQRHLSLDARAREVMRAGNAVVLPAFEYVEQEEGVDSTTFPKNKQSLRQLFDQKRITTFHDFFPKGHNATDYETWFSTDEVYKVTAYQHSYEPYVVLHKEGTPWCDERFIGYGANKAVSSSALSFLICQFGGGGVCILCV